MRRVTVPSFFIAGAPKCGTTALYEFVSTHPDIFMPQIKEPHFFAEDFDGHRGINSLDAYMELFAEAEGRVAGEASVWYLYSDVALRNVLHFKPDARFVVMVREPVGLARSLHAQMLFSLYEDVDDFETAWRKQSLRRQGRGVPASCREKSFLSYSDVASLGRQLDRAVRMIPEGQLKVVVFDDFRECPAKVYADVLEFLGVKQDDRTEFPVHNGRKRHRSRWLAHQLGATNSLPGVWSLRARSVAARAFGESRVCAMRQSLLRLNTAKPLKQPLDPAFENELRGHFRDDVKLLSDIVKRDLTHWASEE